MMNREPDIKIVAPLYAPHEVEYLIRAGASELFCGVLENEGGKCFRNSFNTRGASSANLANFKELAEVVKRACARQVKVNFTVNNRFYAPRQFERALEHAERACAAGVDALIVGDVGLLLALKKHDFFGRALHVSSVTAVFNSKAALFFRKLGASRIILPSSISLEEIEELRAADPQGEYEAFILNRKCHNITGFCTFQHSVFTEMRMSPFLFRQGDVLRRSYVTNFLLSRAVEKTKEKIFLESFGCLLPYSCAAHHAQADEQATGPRRRLWDADTFLNACGACAMYRMRRLGVGYVKIICRSHTTKRKIKDVRFIRALADLTNTAQSQEDFIEKARGLRRACYGPHACADKYCYY